MEVYKNVWKNNFEMVESSPNTLYYILYSCMSQYDPNPNLLLFSQFADNILKHWRMVLILIAHALLMENVRLTLLQFIGFA